MLCNPGVLGGPQKRGNIQNGYLNPAFSVAHKWSEMIHIPCALGGPKRSGQHQNLLSHPFLLEAAKKANSYATPTFSGITKNPRGTQSEMSASPLPSRGPINGHKWSVTPALSGVPRARDKNQNWLPHSCLLGCPNGGGNAMLPLLSGGGVTRSREKIGDLACSGAHN